MQEIVKDEAGALALDTDLVRRVERFLADLGDPFQMFVDAVCKDASAVSVNDADGYRLAGTSMGALKELGGEIRNVFEPMRAIAHKLHKLTCAAADRHLDRLDETRRDLEGRMNIWRNEQDRLAREREREMRARDAAAERERLRIEAEEQQLADAVELESLGRVEEAEALLAEPINVPKVEAKVIYVPSVAPKVKGLSETRSWKCELLDPSLGLRALANSLPPASAIRRHLCDVLPYLVPDTKAIGQLARSHREQAQLPGVRFYEDRGFTVRSG